MIRTVRIVLTSILVLACCGTALALQQPNSTDILIEARVLTISQADFDRLGSFRGAPPPAAGASRAYASKIPDGVTWTLLTNPGSKVLHSVHVQGENLKPARVRVGSRLRAADEYLDVAINLEITPQVLPRREMASKVVARVEILGGGSDATAAAQPVFTSAPLEKELRIREGESIIFGELISPAEVQSLLSIPAVRDNPLLSYLFQPSTESQVIVVLTPHLIGLPAEAADPGPPARTASSRSEPRPAATRYTVQVAAYDKESQAQALVDDLKTRYPDVYIETAWNGRAIYRVRVGRSLTVNAARQLETRLKAESFNPYVAPMNSGS